MGVGFVFDILNIEVYDSIIKVGNDIVMDMVCCVVREEGILVGILFGVVIYVVI